MTEDKPKKKTKCPPNPARDKRAKHANRIAHKLKEKSFRFRKQTSKLIFVCGHDFVDEILRQTFEVEENGGLLVNDGHRRRAPGGVFMKLAKENMTHDQRIYFLYNRRRKAVGEQTETETEGTPAEPQAESSNAAALTDAKPNTAPTSPLESKPLDTPENNVSAEDTEAVETPPDVPDTSPEPLPPLDTVPAEVRGQLKPLYGAHDKFQKRVAELEASGTTGGLKAARLMTQATRKKINAILTQYTDA